VGAGVAGAAALLRAGEVRLGVWRLQGLVATACLALALALGLGLGTFAGASPAPGLLLAAAGAAALAAAVPGRAAPTSLALAAAAGAATLAAPGLAAGVWWAAVAPLTATAVLGTALAAMLLGHWYLVDHGMPLAPLRRLTLAYGIAVAARIGVLAVAAARTPGLGERFGSAEAFLRGGGATLLLVAAFGVLLPPLLAAGAWGTLRVPNTQSATGILYVAVIAAFTGELAATGAGW
jgi:hypothetical protein